MRFLDLAVILAYLIAITWFGARFRKGQSNLGDYFLGGRNAPWWAIALSIVSAETSTLTIVGTPGLSFAGNLGFLQLVFGYLLGRVAVSVLFLPLYFRGEMFTAYELMRRRFGERIRRLTAAIFLITRALAEAVVRRAINVIKDRIAAMDWQVRVRRGALPEDVAFAGRKLRALRRTLEEPNPADTFRTLMEQVIEDALTGGFGAIEMEPTGDAELLAMLWPVDGASIRINAKWDGAKRRPLCAGGAGATGVKCGGAA